MWSWWPPRMGWWWSASNDHDDQERVRNQDHEHDEGSVLVGAGDAGERRNGWRFASNVAVEHEEGLVRVPNGVKVLLPSTVTEGWPWRQNQVLATTLVELHLPSSLIRIEARALQDLPLLQTVKVVSRGDNANDRRTANSIPLPANLEGGHDPPLEEEQDLLTIGEQAFCRCTSLRSVCFVDEQQRLHKIGRGAFRECSNLSQVQFDVSCLSVVGPSAFGGCAALVRLDWSKAHVQHIEPSTFQKCTALETIVLPPHVTTIANHAFFGCSRLRSINLLQDLDAAPRKTRQRRLEHIGHYAFAGCTSLGTIVIPASVVKLGRRAFGFCTSLAVVELESMAHVQNIMLDCVALEHCPALHTFRLALVDIPTAAWPRVLAKCFQDNNDNVGNGGLLYHQAGIRHESTRASILFNVLKENVPLLCSC